MYTLSLREGAYAGRVVKVADAANETLALVIKGFLDEAGIPVLIQKGGASTYMISSPLTRGAS